MNYTIKDNIIKIADRYTNNNNNCSCLKLDI